MMAHPSWRTLADPGSTALRRFEVRFTGKSAHAAAAPELGLNALDAEVLTFNGVNAWRQHLPESARVHGVILDGGKVPNIIPDSTVRRFFLRSPDNTFLDVMERRFVDIVNGAALMTGTKAEVKPVGLPCKARLPNPALNRMFVTASTELGMNPVLPQHSGRGSSDFGDFSQACPGVHPYFGITNKEVAAHSMEFAEAAGTDHAMLQMLKAAAAMAATAYEFFSDQELRRQVVQAA